MTEPAIRWRVACRGWSAVAIGSPPLWPLPASRSCRLHVDRVPGLISAVLVCSTSSPSSPSTPSRRRRGVTGGR